MKKLIELQIKINEFGIDEFRFSEFDGDNLMLIGSPNLAYYHILEITFKQIFHINCPMNHFSPSRPPRFATNAERNAYKIQSQIDDEDLMIILDDFEGILYYVVCEDFEFELVNQNLLETD